MSAARLKIGDGINLPLDAVTQTFGILGKRGVGKTHAAGVLGEEMLEHGAQVVVIDPIGVWWGLRSNANGTGPGYPILVLGGEHGDLPLEAAGGRMIADFVVGKTASVVLDLGLHGKGEQARFVTDFLERLFQKNRLPLHLILDEADAFAPQRVRGMERCFGAVDSVVRRGRARGLGVTLVTQRSAAINKDVLTQIEILMAFRTIAPHDRAAVEAWVEVHGDEAQAREMIRSLATLKKGECWLWSPSWLEVLERVQIRRRRTFDSSATPEAGKILRAPKALAKVDVEALRDGLASLVEKAEQEDPKRLNAKIAQLGHDLAVAEREALEKGRTIERIASAPKAKGLPVLKTEQIRRVEAAVRQVVKSNENLRAVLNEVRDRLSGPGGIFSAVIEPPATAQEAKPVIVQHSFVRIGKESTFGRAPTVTVQPVVAGVNRAFAEVMREGGGGTVFTPEKIGQIVAGAKAKGPRRMLEALASRHPHPLTKAQLGILSGYAANGGTFRTYLPQLKRAGLVRDAEGGGLRLTPAGEAEMLDSLGRVHDGAELRALWLESLDGGPRKMLEVLIAAYPVGLSRQELGERSGYAHGGGTFRTYLPKLKRLGLVSDDDLADCLIANRSLFD